MPKFSERLKQLRIESKLSQLDFAKLIKLSKSSVNMYERGEREPNFETLERIADYFNVDMDFLLGKSDVKNKSHWAPALLCEHSGYWDGNRLSEERIAQGYSIKEMSSFLGVREDEYMSLESGASEPTFVMLLRLADVFAYDLDYMCHRTMKLEGGTPQYIGSENLLIKKYRALDDRGQSAVWNTLNHEYESLPGEKAHSAPKEA